MEGIRLNGKPLVSKTRFGGSNPPSPATKELDMPSDFSTKFRLLDRWKRWCLENHVCGRDYVQARFNQMLLWSIVRVKSFVNVQIKGER